MIVKIQLPVASNDPNPKALVYNEERDLEFLMPVEATLITAMGGHPKKFFDVDFIPDPQVKGAEKLVINEEVTDPGW